MRINTQLQRVPRRTTPLWNAILNCASLTLACKSFMQPSACVERFSCNENSHEKISTCKRKIKIGQLLPGQQQELFTTFLAQGAFWLFAIIQRFGKSKFPTYQRPHCYIWSEGTQPGWFNFFLCVYLERFWAAQELTFHQYVNTYCWYTAWWSKIGSLT